MTKDRLFGILSYCGFLVLIPVLKNENEFQHFHASQGLTLYLFASALQFVAKLVPVIGTILVVLVGIAELVFEIIGVINVLKNKQEELPLFGKYQFLK